MVGTFERRDFVELMPYFVPDSSDESLLDQILWLYDNYGSPKITRRIDKIEWNPAGRWISVDKGFRFENVNDAILFQLSSPP